MSSNFVILFVLAVLWTQALAQPNIVFLSEDVSREANLTKSAIQKAISDIEGLGTWNSVLGASPVFTHIAVPTLSASSLATLRTQLRQFTQPSLFVSLIQSEAVGIALSEENVRFQFGPFFRHTLYGPSELTISSFLSYLVAIRRFVWHSRNS
jgi:hypothetical protein